MIRIPRDPGLDNSASVLADGYLFISKRCRRHRSDVFRTRLLLQDTICLSGAPAAAVFYDNDRFQRAGAAPARLNKTLFGKGGVQGLDGEAQRHRKRMLMSLMTPESIRELTELAAGLWRTRIARWAEEAGQIVLFDEAQSLLAQAVCRWAGLPLGDDEIAAKRADFAAMVEGAGAIGPRHWRGRRAHARCVRWAADLIERTRRGEIDVAEERALAVLARYRDPEGRLPDSNALAPDLLSLLRPTVAVDRFIVFVAHALHAHPQWRQRLREDDTDVEPFVQEVRRAYPFFPFVAARVRQRFQWRGYEFPEGTRVLLDLYGTNHDPRLWEQPEDFRPERFRAWEGDPFTLIPQGGGDHYRHHRCAGEWITIELMKQALRQLTREIDYEVPPQNLEIRLSKVPALPESGMVMRGVVPRRSSTPAG